MFANTLTLDVAGVDKTLTRVNQDNFGSVYRHRAADGSETIELTIRHQMDNGKDGKIERHNATIVYTKPATPTETSKFWSVAFNMRAGVGSSPATLVDLATGSYELLASIDNGLSIGEN